MKRICVFLGMLITVCKLQADPSIEWISDSYSSFDFILTDTGPGWSGTILSPSGLWQYYTGNIIQYPSTVSGRVLIDNYLTGTLLDQLPSQFLPAAPYDTTSIGTFGTYNDFYYPIAPINDGSPLTYGYLCSISQVGPYQDWSGTSTISVTSIPNPNDISTWTWTAEYKASGEYLEDIPEPTIRSIVALAATLGIASIIRKKSALLGN
jgi:hypothetical protein